MSYTLVIAEKPSVAQSLAKVLHATNHKDGFFEGNGYLVSWCVGHLVELAPADAYDEKYGKWNQTDLPILPGNWKYQVSASKRKQFKIVKDLMHRDDVTSCYNCCDAGREGENIFRNVYYQAQCTKPVKRLWISSMEDKAIEEGFRNLRDGSEYDNLFASAQARAQADWLVGINATRLFTTLYGSLIRVGRVQSPVLTMICERAEKVGSFVKQPYSNLHLNCGDVTFTKEKIMNKEEANKLLNLCQGKPVLIKSVSTEKKTISPPKLYDLTTLQREANRLHGYTAQQVLDTLQSLYEKKLCTYPRTDSNYLTEDMEESTRSLIKQCSNLYSFSAAYDPNIRRCINNAKVSDHHAILPTVEIAHLDFNSLSDKEATILSQITMRLFCATADPEIYEQTKVKAVCCDNEFFASGKQIKQAGWSKIEKQYKSTLKSKEDSEESNEASALLPPLTEGYTYPGNVAKLSDHFTTPPKQYTEDSILAAMETAGNDQFMEDTEKKGLGTPATRAGILEKLVKSNYVKRKGKSLIPTMEGIAVVKVLPDTLKSPSLTAEWENTLMDIEKGICSPEEFMRGIQGMVTGLVKSYEQVSPDTKAQFSDAAGKKDQEAIGECPWCGSEVREGKSNYYCSNRECTFRLWKDNQWLNKMKKPLTRRMVIDLLSAGRSHVKGLYSEKSGKPFDADLVLSEATDKQNRRVTSFRLEFPER